MIITKPYLLVIDFEATCWENKRQPDPDGRGFVEPRMEIIEFGCVLLRMPDFKAVTEFQTFVKPKLNPTLSDFCKILTTIKQSDVDHAPAFPEALANMLSWLRAYVSPLAGIEPGKMVTFGSWGYYDRNQLKLDCDLHSVPYPFDEDHFNIKLHVAERKWGGKGVGVGKAHERLGLKFEGTPHRGIDDARMISKILATVEGQRS